MFHSSRFAWVLRSVHRLRCGGLALCVALGASVALAASVASSAPEAGVDGALKVPRADVIRVVLRAPGRALENRVRGQLVDLDVQLLLDDSPVEHSREGRRDSALRLSRAHDADLIVWVRESEVDDEGSNKRGEAVVVVWFAESASDYTRSVGPSLEQLVSGQDSVALEVAALTVRSAVRSANMERVPELPPSDEPSETTDLRQLPSPREPAPRVAEPSANPEPSDGWRLELGVGARAGWTGVGTALAPRVHGGVRIGPLRSVATFSVGLPSNAVASDIEFELRRDQLGVEASLEVVRAGLTRWSPIVRFDVERSSRTTRATPADVTASASHVVVNTSFGAGAFFEWRVHSEHQLQLQVMTDWYPVRTDHTVRATDGSLVSSTPTWRLQPSVGIAWGWLP